MATPSREELIDLSMEIHSRALNHVRTYTNGRGEEKSTEQPDFRAALEALKFTAQLAGYLAKVGEMDLPAVVRELERLGKRVVVAKPS